MGHRQDRASGVKITQQSDAFRDAAQAVDVEAKMTGTARAVAMTGCDLHPLIQGVTSSNRVTIACKDPT